MKGKRPLYRKVNTKARGVNHDFDGDYRHDRNTKVNNSDRPRSSMGGKKKRGLDYTPLFRFLLSKVGQDWDVVYKEVVSRLDRPDPIFWIVNKNPEDETSFVRCGESSYYSKMYIDSNNKLQLVNPNLSAKDLSEVIEWVGGTSTLNGKRV